jgi:hypothetical protein
VVAVDVPGISFASNNVGAQLISTATTYTAAQGAAGSIQQPIIINGNATGGVTSTLNFVSASFGNLISIEGTFAFAQSAAALALGNALNYAPTIKNTAASGAISLGISSAINYSPTFTADTATVTGSVFIGFNSQATTSVVNAGTLTGVTLRAFNVGTHTIGASTTVTALTGLVVNNASNSGTLTTQLGIDIAALTAGTTNIGIRLAAMNNPLQFGVTTTGPTTGNLTSNTNAVLTLFHGVTNYFLMLAFNDAGTVRYFSMQINGATTPQPWNMTTALPT